MCMNSRKDKVGHNLLRHLLILLKWSCEIGGSCPGSLGCRNSFDIVPILSFFFGLFGEDSAEVEAVEGLSKSVLWFLFDKVPDREDMGGEGEGLYDICFKSRVVIEARNFLLCSQTFRSFCSMIKLRIVMKSVGIPFIQIWTKGNENINYLIWTECSSVFTW